MKGSVLCLVLLVACSYGLSLDEKYKMGHQYFVTGDYVKSELIWRELLKEVPSLELIWTNLATTLENSGRLDEAYQTYKEALAKVSDEQIIYVNLCALRTKQFIDATIFDKGNAVRSFLASEAKLFCEQATTLHPENPKGWQVFGLLSTETFDYESSVEYLLKALSLDPLDAKSNLYLSTAYSRKGDLVNAVSQAERTLLVAPNPETYNSHGIISSLCELDNRGKALKSYHEAIVLFAKDQRSNTCPNGYTPVFGWEDELLLKNNDISLYYQYKSPKSKFGMPSPQNPDPKVVSGNNRVNSVPLEWGYHDMEVVKMKNVYLEGNTGVYYNDKCSVFTTGHKEVSRIVQEFLAGRGKTKLIKITDPVASILQQNPGNYYHWVIESLSRFILLKEQVLSKPEHSNMKLLVPKMADHFVQQTIVQLFGFPESRLIWYDRNQQDLLYHLSEVYHGDWHWSPENDLQKGDVSGHYFPPKALLQKLRKELAGWGEGDSHPPGGPVRVLYLTREDATVRKITPEDERRIVVAMMDLVGAENVEWLFTAGLSVTEQIELFKSATIIVAPHGAGLTNMLWSRPGTSVIQFPMNPNTDNCFGYLAMALDIDYWIVPQINSYYYGQFNALDQLGIRAITNVLQTILKRKNIK
eukprot:TRINITY_DN6492_c0_g1_i1.p1 TRINITY_DN6492_c0_g1~~TRINITY_DN6492_c0_g1_i1.p1  ORF type:complete len:641 (+),score=156.36 TRINITY_DN6492_c0_g1_i1:44-1966(+)